MICGVSCPRQKATQELEEGSVEVMGTWDYKWPVGKRVRVAFQRPADPELAEEFVAAREIVEECANRWNTAMKPFLEQHPKEGIGLVFIMDREFEAPLGAEHWEPDAAQRQSQAAQQAQAPAQGKRRARLKDVFRHRSPIADQRQDYDVLVSFADLPVERVDAFRHPEDAKPTRLYLPYSELGSYARRVDYGEPTIFLGRLGVAIKQSKTLAEYLKSVLGQHAIVHEFGHALGLAHSHQNPKYGDISHLFPDPEVVAREIEQVHGLSAGTLTADDVNRQVIKRWPGETFSDWLDPKGADIAELKSVMTPAVFNGLLLKNSDAGGIKAQMKRLLSNDDTKITALLTPQEVDIKTLLRMYWPSIHIEE